MASEDIDNPQQQCSQTLHRARLLTHRGNISGPGTAKENSIDALTTALALGYGIELDVRTGSDGDYYLSHDALVDDHSSGAERWYDFIRHLRDSKLVSSLTGGMAHDGLRRSTPRIWVNIKDERIDMARLAATISEELGTDAMSLFIFFDLELVFGAYRAIHIGAALSTEVQLAWRMSDLPSEGIEHILGIISARDTYNDWLWLDGMDDPAWWDKGHSSVSAWIAAAQSTFAPWRVALVAPDLHGIALAESAASVASRTGGSWPDLICTDYAADAAIDVIAQAINVRAGLPVMPRLQ